jgi:tetratricopeptide (TPR) repeat protein
VGVLLIAHFHSVDLAQRLLNGLRQYEATAESPFVQGPVWRCRAQVLQQAGDLQAAYEDYVKVSRIAEKYAFGPTWQSAGNNMAVVEMERGQYAEAVRRLSEVEHYGLAREEKEILQSVYYNLAICHWETGDYAECARAAKQLQTIQEGMAVKSRRHEAWSMLGLVALRQGNVTEAKSCEREILLWEGATPSWYGDTSYREMFLARLAALEGNEADAMRRIRSGIEAYEDRDFFCRSRLQLEWARLAMATDPDEAVSVARGVRESASRSGAVPLVESADRILDRLGFLGVEPSGRA